MLDTDLGDNSNERSWTCHSVIAVTEVLLL